MQLKGKKGNAGPGTGWKAQELPERRTDRGREGAKTGREREGQRLNFYRILAWPLTSLETFRKSLCLGFVICKMGNTIVSLPSSIGL